jgi:VanZ family protein
MRLWLYAAIGWTLLILTLCWTPQSVVEKAGGEHSFTVPHADKIAHAGMFFGFGFLWMQASPSPRRFGPVILGGLALAVITELGQMSNLVNRDGGFDDGLADLVGLTLGALAFQRFAASRRAASDRLARTEGA